MDSSPTRVCLSSAYIEMPLRTGELGTAASTTTGTWASLAASQISGAIKVIGSRDFVAAVLVAATNSSGTPCLREASNKPGQSPPCRLSSFQPMPEAHQAPHARYVTVFDS